ncbi:winged helix-turn-helix transcriptional regulator [Nocardia sp. NPDC049149]|uniref:winged helix-turn-helix transcriptional regulator n=1 Tax=Nocardia sp. NPDC049149 TaxID=3364315 RepID=UPI0037225986
MQDGRLERDCSVFRAASTVGDAWSWLVLREALFNDVRRFDQFQQRLGIARSTLTNRLGRLVAAQMLQRNGSDYVPTPRGLDFLACLLAAMHWGDRWSPDEDGPPVQVSHLGCGQPMHAELSCKHCDRPVVAQEVSFDRAPEPMRRPDGPRRRNRIPGLDLLERGRPCSIARTLQVIGDLWSALIIQECFLGVHRFDQFQQRLAIASNILSHRLARLVELDILAAPPPDHPHDGYRLTDKGIALYPVPLAMLTWGDRWCAVGEPPMTLTHTPCGCRLRAVLGCSECGRRVERVDLRWDKSVPSEDGAVAATAGRYRR